MAVASQEAGSRPTRLPASASSDHAGQRQEQTQPGERFHQLRSAVSRSTSRSALRRATATTRPRPTTTSEAAMPITISANTWPLCVAPVARERDQREVAGVQHQLHRQQQDQRAAAREHAEHADPEHDRRHRRRSTRRRSCISRRPRPCGGTWCTGNAVSAPITAACSSSSGCGRGARERRRARRPRGLGRLRAEHDAAHRRHQQQDRGGLESQQVAREEAVGDEAWGCRTDRRPSRRGAERLARDRHHDLDHHAAPATTAAPSCHSGMSRVGSSARPPR